MEISLKIMTTFLLLFHRALLQQGSPDPTGKFHLINAQHGLCLSSDASWSLNGKNLVQKECLPESGQTWSFDHSNPGSLVRSDPMDADLQKLTLVPSHLKGYWYLKNDDGDCVSSDPRNPTLINLSTCKAFMPSQMWKRFHLNPETPFTFPIDNFIVSGTVIPPIIPTVLPSIIAPVVPPILPTGFPSISILPTHNSTSPTSIETLSPMTWMPTWVLTNSSKTTISPTSTSSHTIPTSSLSTSSSSSTTSSTSSTMTQPVNPTTGLPAVLPTTTTPTPIKPDPSSPVPFIWLLFGPIDLNGNPVLWPLNLPPIETDINTSILSIDPNLALSEKYQSNWPLEGSFSTDYPFQH